MLELYPLRESLELLELLAAAELLEDPGSLEDEVVGAEDESDDPGLADAWEALPLPFPLPLAEAPKALFPNDSRAAAASAAEPAQTDFFMVP